MRYVNFLAIAIPVISFLACQSSEQKGEQLAKQHCSSCHQYADPKLLDKKSWEQVLPQMAFRMGFKNMDILLSLNETDRNTVLKTLPKQPLVNETEWEQIRNYYMTHAPDTLPITTMPPVNTPLNQFEDTVISFPFQPNPLITLLHADTFRRELYIGNRQAKLYRLNNAFAVLDSFQLKSPPSALISTSNYNLVLTMGIMDPNDLAKGEVVNLYPDTRTLSTLIDSLQRPVYVETAHLNKDTLRDLVVAAFGHYTGALIAFEKIAHEKYRKHILYSAPGTRKLIARDFDRNGLQDLLVLKTQGDEQLQLLLNQGNFKFRLVTLLQFPPVYGSSYFDIADMDNDGDFDILYTNGDNADYSPILKPYHGLRIFTNDGTNNFRESWFYPMHGAYKAITRDFDDDGDLDIAAIAFFPDFYRTPQYGFLYFEKTPSGFLPQATPLATSGRWIVMEAVDLEQDGDDDLILGALDFPALVPPTLFNRWMTEETSILLLRNKESQ